MKKYMKYFSAFILAGALLSACNSPVGKSDTTAPSVSSTGPVNLSIGVATNSNLTITFNEEMDASTINAGTFTLKQGSTAIAGAVTYAGTTANFNPTVDLASSTVYTAAIGIGALDLAGNALTAATTWSITTAVAPDTTAPSINSSIPLNLASNIATNGNITATFSEVMDSATLTSTTFTLKQGSIAIAGAVTYIGSTASFNPAVDLASSTVYTASIGTGAEDLAGNALAAANTWTFTTAAAPDTTAPTVASNVPLDLASDIAINANITASFSEAMDSATLTGTTFTLKQGLNSVAGAVSYLGTTASFNPSANLAYSTVYTASIGTGAEDLAGNALTAAKTWSFTTSPASTLAPVDLGSAGNFVILSKSGIDTASATTAITGDIGVSPAAATYITGFSLAMDATNTFSISPLVTQKVYAADYTPPTPSYMTTAVGDMETAYTNAAGRPDPDFTELGAGDISGMTLVPGLYKWGTALLITSDITLSGGPTDIWIFQIAEGLTFANGVNVVLAGGAVPENIFWQTFGAVSLGTTVHAEGIILSYSEIALATGATINGRLYSQTAVTLDANAVTQPAQ